MAKTTAWLITLVGAILTLALLGVAIPASDWIIALSWLVIGVTKLMRNYK